MQQDMASFVPEKSMRIAQLLTHPVEVVQAAAPSTSVPSGLWDAMTILIEAVNCVLLDDEEDARQYVLSAFDVLRHGASLPPAHSIGPRRADDRQACRGGLAGWQMRRLAMYIDMHLSESLLCKDLAHLVNLSISHFIRAFKASFGCSPHVYLVRRRIEYAQGLMLSTDAPLGQIALDCGLADQAHLSRLFKQMVGDSPAAWRRARVQPSAL
jgi:AraC family transcriptional regulator